jgi:hypothetical protein
MLAIWGLMQPAKITSACDALGDAINELPATKVKGEATLRVPTREQDQRTESVLRYVRGLNRGRGMGFVIQRKRISYSFVLTMAIKAASAMVLLFPVMLSLTRVEADEDEKLNATATSCVAACLGL